MDGLDTRILRELMQGSWISPLDSNFRKSYATIARKLDVDEDTVRYRIRRFQETAFLAGWRVFVNPRLMGGGHVQVWFDAQPSDSRDETLDKIALMPAVLVVVRCVGSLVGVVLQYDNVLLMPRQIEFLRRLAGAEVVYSGKIPFPECKILLSKTDWAILRLLQGDHRKSHASLARELGLSARTVKRRLERMVRERAVFALAALNPKALRGSMMTILLVACPENQQAEVGLRIEREFGDRLWFVLRMLPEKPGGPTPCGYNLIVQNPAEAKQILHRVKGLPGVAEVRMDLFEEINVVSETFEEEAARGVGLAST